MRSKLVARGTRSIFTIGRMFRIHDEDNSRALDRAEFKKCMNDVQMKMTDKEVDTLFNAFDTDNDH